MSDIPPPDDGDGDGAPSTSAASSPSRSRRRWSARSSTTPCRSSSSRALPDVRDGLKPVHRRILWGMYDLGARPDRPTMKCAHVIGDVMGKYHPHGDTAIYDALVRMAQDFSLRHPLIDGHGNFGSPDDPPGRRPLHRVPAGAARHAHARRHRRGHRRLRRQLLGRGRRSRRSCRPGSPTCWSTAARASPWAWPPTSRPTTWARSSTPPCTCSTNPDATPDDLMEFVKGPDFPTGGLILGRAGHPRRLPHRPRLDPDAGRGRDRGGPAQRPHRRHRAAVPGQPRPGHRPRSPSWSTPASSTASPTSTTSRPGARHPPRRSS